MIDRAKLQRLAFAVEQHRAVVQGQSNYVRSLADSLRDARHALQSSQSAHYALSTKYPHLRESRGLDRETLRNVDPADLTAVGIDPALLTQIDELTAALAAANAANAAAQAELSQRAALQQSLDQYVTDHA